MAPPASSEPRLRRSALYVPGVNERALTKAADLSADVVILDLEDAVAANRKDEARDRVAGLVGNRGFGRREVVVRVNGLETDEFREDLAAVVPQRPDAILVPKLRTVAEVEEVTKALDRLTADDAVDLWLMLETPAAVVDAPRFLAASGRIRAAVLGTNDLAMELGITAGMTDRAPLRTALGWSVLAARAAGVAILDSIYVDLDDDEGFAAECQEAKQYGFDGKTVIHPRQIEPCNAAFSPTDAEVARARRLLDAYAKARTDGRAVATVDGRMIEQLHVDQARATLAAADAAFRAADEDR